MILLMTGSRDWVDVREIRTTINEAYERSGEPAHRFLVVRHGDCPTGADHLASLIVYAHHQEGNYNIIEDPMAADWQHAGCTHQKKYKKPGVPTLYGDPDADWYCPIQGPVRNQAMVDRTVKNASAGTTVEVHAFPLGSSRGTIDCKNRATAAGFTVFEHQQHLEARQYVGAT